MQTFERYAKEQYYIKINLCRAAGMRLKEEKIMAMLYPTYNDLINAVNKDVEEGEEPVVKSRYSIVVGTAKRARQIIDGAPVLVPETEEKKPLSTAVEEFFEGKVSIVPPTEGEELSEAEAETKAYAEADAASEETAEEEHEEI